MLEPINRLNHFSAGDSVPNAGNANGELQAGTGEPARGGEFRANAAAVNAPLSQSSLRAGGSLGESGRAADVCGAMTGRTSLPSRSPRGTIDGLADAQAKAAICEEFIRLTSTEHLSLRQAAARLGRPVAFFAGRDSILARYLGEGLAGLLPPARGIAAAGNLTERIEALGWFIPAAEFFYLISNRNRYAGSVPEAIRRTISLPHLPVGWQHGLQKRFLRKLGLDALPLCPADIRQEILARERLGKPHVPERIARQITRRASPAVVQFSRNPTNAALDYANASGGSKFIRIDGEYVPLRAGRRMQPDDGSINFCVCVPWQFPTSLTSRKWGVLVGRFQLLLAVDALSHRISARSFVVRPRESYRTEDALHLYNVFMREHGVPDEIFHEGHVWNSGRVKDCLDLLKVRRQLVTSPHAKAAVEGRFNKLWTVLSVLSAGQIGRYRGEMQRENELLMSCRQGHTDPRRVFPMIDQAIAMIDQAIAEANATAVNTDVGTWVPDELWSEHLAATPLRKLDPDGAWMFAPCCETRTMRNGIKVSFPLFEELSVPFLFAAPWMQDYERAKVKVYFDPWGDRATGKLVLAQNWGELNAGAVLGDAVQTNDIANYARLMLGIGNGPNDDARKIRQQQISAMRSNRKAIVAGTDGLTVVEARDGIENAITIEKNKPESITPVRSATGDRLRDLEQFERENQHLFL